jgi:F-type H+-transporting ATPase subunit epsilon
MAVQPKSLTLEVVTPARQVIHETVDSVQLPGLNGYLGVLPGHAPLVTELGLGHLSYRKGSETLYLSLFNGFAEVLPDRVIVLAEVAERAEEIDVERARKALQRAKDQLFRAHEKEVDWEQARAAFQRALIRLQVAEHGGAPFSQEVQERLLR